MSKNCTSYRNTVQYDKKRTRMKGKNRCYSRASVKRRNGVWRHASGKRYYTRNKNNPGPYAKISRLGRGRRRRQGRKGYDDGGPDIDYSKVPSS